MARHFFRGLGGMLTLSAGELQVTVILVNAIEGLDFGVECVAFFHGRWVL